MSQLNFFLVLNFIFIFYFEAEIAIFMHWHASQKIAVYTLAFSGMENLAIKGF